ncbi:LamB/YcsF family protein, partial [Devosia sp.]|uniref:LamB/YcsF family protein n=1 Tax=Devosia sp. TaxID=1871048 RepID=UPI001AC26184
MPGDEDLLDIVSSASIACGGHAGDDETMRRTVRAARDRGVAIGAHPGFADRENFGRRRLVLPPDELDAQLRGQVRRLVEIAEAEGATVRYLKLHGALANMAAEEPAVAALCFASVTGLVPDLAILAIDNSAQVEVAETMGYAGVREAYADRAYLPNGLLVP